MMDAMFIGSMHGVADSCSLNGGFGLDVANTRLASFLFRCSRLPIQNDFSDQVESYSRRIQVVDGAQPLLHSGLFRASQAFRDQLIEQINRVILGYGLEHACESN